MPAVVFAPDRAVRPPTAKIGLVLGAGGVLGAAWMTGALVRLQERLPGPAAEVDLMVGTSAGSVLAAALRCRASLAEITAWQRGDATGELSESAALAAQDGPLPPLPYPRPGSLPLSRAALTLQVPPWVGASGWLPHGRGQHTALRSLVGALHDRGTISTAIPAPHEADRAHGRSASLGGRPHLDRGHGLRHRAPGDCSASRARRPRR